MMPSLLGPGLHSISHVITVLGALVRSDYGGPDRVVELIAIEKENPGLLPLQLNLFSRVRQRRAFRSDFDFVYSPVVR